MRLRTEVFFTAARKRDRQPAEDCPTCITKNSRELRSVELTAVAVRPEQSVPLQAVSTTMTLTCLNRGVRGSQSFGLTMTAPVGLSRPQIGRYLGPPLPITSGTDHRHETFDQQRLGTIIHVRRWRDSPPTRSAYSQAMAAVMAVLVNQNVRLSEI